MLPERRNRAEGAAVSTGEDLQPGQQHVSQIKCYLREVITPAVRYESRNGISWGFERDGVRKPPHMLLILSPQQLESPRTSSHVADKTSVEQRGFLEISSVFLSLPDTKSQPQRRRRRRPPETTADSVYSAPKRGLSALYEGAKQTSVIVEEDEDERAPILQSNTSKLHPNLMMEG